MKGAAPSTGDSGLGTSQSSGPCRDSFEPRGDFEWKPSTHCMGSQLSPEAESPVYEVALRHSDTSLRVEVILVGQTSFGH